MDPEIEDDVEKARLGAEMGLVEVRRMLASSDLAGYEMKVGS
ncbi:MAG: hypothetical protein QXM50_07430 [Candidatus Caldarchaeum sp.]